MNGGNHNWNNHKTAGVIIIDAKKAAKLKSLLAKDAAIDNQKREAEKMNLKFDYADSKTAVVDVDSEGKIHRAVLTNDEEKVIVYESQELDYPKWGIYAVSLEEYLKTIRDVPWISKNLTEEEQELLHDLKNKEDEKK